MNTSIHAKKMIANIEQNKFVPLPDDDITKINISAFMTELASKGINFSYPSLRNLLRGVKEVVNGFQLVKLEPIPITQFKAPTRPIITRKTDRVPVPVTKGSASAISLHALVNGLTITELHKKFQSNKTDQELLHDLQYYANHFGYDIHYSNDTKVVQIVLPEGHIDIAYE